MSEVAFYNSSLHLYNLGAGTTDIPYIQIYQLARQKIAYQITSFVTKQITAYYGIQSARLDHSVGIAAVIAVIGFC
jgi:predicted RecB family nuclease